MPRRHTYSAAGALAAVLLVAASATSYAQNATGQPLRGAIAPQEDENARSDANPPALTAKPSAGRQPAPADQQPSEEGNEDVGPPPPLGGLGDEGISDETGVPALGGIGDEPLQPELEEEPGLGIAPEFGESSFTLLGPDYLYRSRFRPFPPRRHDLDPYVPIGFKLGSFLLFTEAEIGTILTDNVLATKFDRHSDAAFEVAPEVKLESNWSRHYFAAEFAADRSWYRDFSEEDDRDYQALLRGRLDVTRRTHLELELGKSLTQAGRDSISLTDIVGNQTDLHEQHIIASADHTFNRLTLKLTGSVAEYNYDDIADPGLIDEDPFDPSIVVPFDDIRDYTEQELTLRSTYELKPETAVFVEGSINQLDYREPTQVVGFQRDSNGFEALAGMQFRLTGKLTGEVSVGWGEQQPIDDLLEPLQGFLINADVIWQPTPMTKVEFIANTDLAETSIVDSLGAIDRYYELSVQHAFWRYLVLGAYVSYEIADYADTSLVEERIKEGMTAEYYFNPYFSVYGRYEHTDFLSTDTLNEFTENEVRLGVRIRK